MALQRDWPPERQPFRDVRSRSTRGRPPRRETFASSPACLTCSGPAAQARCRTTRRRPGQRCSRPGRSTSAAPRSGPPPPGCSTTSGASSAERKRWADPAVPARGYIPERVDRAAHPCPPAPARPRGSGGCPGRPGGGGALADARAEPALSAQPRPGLRGRPVLLRHGQPRSARAGHGQGVVLARPAGAGAARGRAHRPEEANSRLAGREAATGRRAHARLDARAGDARRQLRDAADRRERSGTSPGVRRDPPVPARTGRRTCRAGARRRSVVRPPQLCGRRDPEAHDRHGRGRALDPAARVRDGGRVHRSGRRDARPAGERPRRDRLAELAIRTADGSAPDSANSRATSTPCASTQWTGASATRR